MSFWPDSGRANRWSWSMSDPPRSIKRRMLPARFRFRLRSWSRGCGSYHASARSWLTAAVRTALLRRKRPGPCASTVTPPDTSATGCRNGRTPGMVSSRTESTVRLRTDEPGRPDGESADGDAGRPIHTAGRSLRGAVESDHPACRRASDQPAIAFERHASYSQRQALGGLARAYGRCRGNSKSLANLLCTHRARCLRTHGSRPRGVRFRTCQLEAYRRDSRTGTGGETPKLGPFADAGGQRRPIGWGHVQKIQEGAHVPSNRSSLVIHLRAVCDPAVHVHLRGRGAVHGAVGPCGVSPHLFADPGRRLVGALAVRP